MANISSGKIVVNSCTGRENWIHNEIQRLGIDLIPIALTMTAGSLMPLWYYPDSKNQLVLTKESSNRYAVSMVQPRHLKDKILYASFMLA